MYDYEKIVNSLVDKMNCDLPFSDKVEYKLLEYSVDFNFVLLERKDKYGFEYPIFQLNGTSVYPRIFYDDRIWGFDIIRSFGCKETAYAAYKALTASSYC